MLRYLRNFFPLNLHPGTRNYDPSSKNTFREERRNHIFSQFTFPNLGNDNCSDPLVGGGAIYSNVFFVQSVLANRYILRTELSTPHKKTKRTKSFQFHILRNTGCLMIPVLYAFSWGVIDV